MGGGMWPHAFVLVACRTKACGNMPYAFVTCRHMPLTACAHVAWLGNTHTHTHTHIHTNNHLEVGERGSCSLASLDRHDVAEARADELVAQLVACHTHLLHPWRPVRHLNPHNWRPVTHFVLCALFSTKATKAGQVVWPSVCSPHTLGA
jgi:hypothetical protein